MTIARFSYSLGHCLLALFAFLPAQAGLAAQQERAELGHDQMMSAAYAAEGPVDNRFFMPLDGAAAAHHRFSGAITIPQHAMQTEPAAILPPEVAGKMTQLFPGITLHFVSHDEYLLPVERDLMVALDSDSFWQIQVSPGRTWSEEVDGGMSRASFPFILTSARRWSSSHYIAGKLLSSPTFIRIASQYWQ